jgi:hypothetical protein
MDTPPETLIVACVVVTLVLCSHIGAPSALLILSLCGILALLGGGMRDTFHGAPHRRGTPAFALRSLTDEFAEGDQTPNPRKDEGRGEEGPTAGPPKEPHAPASPIDWIQLREDVSRRHFRPMASDSVARLRQADADFLHAANGRGSRQNG